MYKANSDDSTSTVLLHFGCVFFFVGFLQFFFFFYKNLKNKHEGIYKIHLIYVTDRI